MTVPALLPPLAQALAEWGFIQPMMKAEKMKQEQLVLDEAAFLGVTDWIDGATIGNPAYSGWYDVRYKMSDEERAARGVTHTRRWWHSDVCLWSWPVEVGNVSAEEEEAAKSKLGRQALLDALEYRGLVEQPEHMKLRRR